MPTVPQEGSPVSKTRLNGLLPVPITTAVTAKSELSSPNALRCDSPMSDEQGDFPSRRYFGDSSDTEDEPPQPRGDATSQSSSGFVSEDWESECQAWAKQLNDENLFGDADFGTGTPHTDSARQLCPQFKLSSRLQTRLVPSVFHPLSVPRRRIQRSSPSLSEFSDASDDVTTQCADDYL